MDENEQSRALPASRRTVLGAVGTTIVGGAAVSAEVVEQDAQFSVRQGGECVPVTPLSGEGPVEEFYDYQVPERFVSAENGGSDTGGPYYSSAGTETLQRHDASIAFLYDGPRGLSLVVVHDKVGTSPNQGGAATFEIEGLPADGEWVVKDDLYRDPDTGEFATTNYDRWYVDGTTHTVDWTWGDNGTDGGAFRGLGDAPVVVRPAFNEAATLFGEHYDGTVDAWEFLSADGSGGVQRHSLDMASALTIHPGPCGDAPTEPVTEVPGDGVRAEVREVEFKGCGQAWIVFEEAPGTPVTATVETSTGTGPVELTPAEMTTVPGQYGSAPLYKVRGQGKLLAVEVADERYENDNRCAQNARGSGDDRSRGNGGGRDDDRSRDDDRGRGRGRDPDDEDEHEEDDDEDDEGRGRGRGRGQNDDDDDDDRGRGRGRDDDDDDDEEDEDDDEDDDDEDEDGEYDDDEDEDEEDDDDD